LGEIMVVLLHFVKRQICDPFLQIPWRFLMLATLQGHQPYICLTGMWNQPVWYKVHFILCISRSRYIDVLNKIDYPWKLW
jgi:hypothetical protein